MPGRSAARGRGGRGKLVDPGLPEMTPEQLARLRGDHVSSAATVAGQFDDAISSSSSSRQHNNQSHASSYTSDSVSLTSQTTPSHTSATATPQSQPTSSPAANSTKSALNPNSDTFVPQRKYTAGTGLNVEAKEFVPSFMTPPLQQAPPVGAPDVDEGALLTAQDLLRFENRKCKKDTSLLTTTADMLVDVTSFPGVFDINAQTLVSVVHDSKPITEELIDLAEMLLTWGISNPAFRYTAVRIADLLCQTEIKDQFRPLIFNGLQTRYKEQKQIFTEMGSSKGTDQERGEFKELALFIAEMFYRVRIINKKTQQREVVRVLANALFEILVMLMKWETEDTLMCSCNILKLTGYLLDEVNYRQVEDVMSFLRQRVGSDSISQRVANVILMLLNSRASKWGTKQSQPEPQIRNDVEAPVSAVPEWENYVDDSGEVIEGTDDDDDDFELGEQDDPEADDEIIREYENFVQDFEDHLLMQEFGPAHH